MKHATAKTVIAQRNKIAIVLVTAIAHVIAAQKKVTAVAKNKRASFGALLLWFKMNR